MSVSIQGRNARMYHWLSKSPNTNSDSFPVVDHLVGLRVITEESGFEGETLYCYYVAFKNVIDTKPISQLWKRLIKIEILLEYRATIV